MRKLRSGITRLMICVRIHLLPFCKLAKLSLNKMRQCVWWLCAAMPNICANICLHQKKIVYLWLFGALLFEFRMGRGAPGSPVALNYIIALSVMCVCDLIDTDQFSLRNHSEHVKLSLRFRELNWIRFDCKNNVWSRRLATERMSSMNAETKRNGTRKKWKIFKVCKFTSVWRTKDFFPHFFFFAHRISNIS